MLDARSWVQMHFVCVYIYTHACIHVCIHLSRLETLPGASDPLRNEDWLGVARAPRNLLPFMHPWSVAVVHSSSCLTNSVPNTGLRRIPEVMGWEQSQTNFMMLSCKSKYTCLWRCAARV